MEHYNALSPYLKNRFGCKICKLSLSAGCTCPNRDGTLGTRGCMFCSGSGEFAASGLASIPEQLEQALRTGIREGADYLEIFIEELSDPACAAAVEKVRNDWKGMQK